MCRRMSVHVNVSAHECRKERAPQISPGAELKLVGCEFCAGN